MISILKWLMTPAGVLVLFLLLGSGIGLWALKAQPQGMEGNLVANIAGAFFGAAAIDGVLLMLSRHKHRQGIGAMSVKITNSPEGYMVALSNRRRRSDTPFFNIRLQGPRADWEWESLSCWTGSAGTHNFTDDTLFLSHFSRGVITILLKEPRSGGGNLPHWMVLEWDDINGEHYLRRVLLHAESPPD